MGKGMKRGIWMLRRGVEGEGERGEEGWGGLGGGYNTYIPYGSESIG